MEPGRNFDYPIPYQGKMARATLAQMGYDAEQLRRALRDQDRIPTWVQTYIATAGDRLSTAARYMEYTIQTSNPASLGVIEIPDSLDAGPQAELAQPMRLVGGLVVGPVMMYASTKIPQEDTLWRNAAFLSGALVSFWSLWSYSMVESSRIGQENSYPTDGNYELPSATEFP